MYGREKILRRWLEAQSHDHIASAMLCIEAGYSGYKDAYPEAWSLLMASLHALLGQHLVELVALELTDLFETLEPELDPSDRENPYRQIGGALGPLWDAFSQVPGTLPLAKRFALAPLRGRSKQVLRRLEDGGSIDRWIVGPLGGTHWGTGTVGIDVRGRVHTLGLADGTELLPEIGELRHLRLLGVDASPSRTIPRSWGRLRLTRLHISDGDSLDEPFRTMVRQEALEELRSYLLSLSTAPPDFEAKVLLVGEGAVGKSSLLAALRGERFEKQRSTTHGIEIRPFQTRHTNSARPTDTLTLNFWDFGGQDVYRITHQFFFSRQAVYVLVWKGREGVEENGLDGWLRRIRMRVGTDVRVLIVATHCDERPTELDYPALKAEFGDMLAGSFEIDSQSRRGIPQLEEAIARTACELDHTQVAFNKKWLDARDAITHNSSPHITKQVFLREAAKHGLDETAGEALLGILHTLGHVVHWDVDGLRDWVVLKPEWLTKAIGFVLADRPTRDKRGILSHHRLARIWRDHGRKDEPTYDSEHFAFFLRLMEEYDVSARVEGRHESLVPQLVPFESPEVPWSESPPAELKLICSLAHDPPGLLAWTTVRAHEWATGIHWRRGVFLRDPEGHEALVELVDSVGSKEVQFTVRGANPSHLMSQLRAGLESLIKERWPWLSSPSRRYSFVVPCYGRLGSGEPCTRRFPLDKLPRALNAGRRTLFCLDCEQDCEVIRLLFGHQLPDAPLVAQVAALEARLLAEFKAASTERREYALMLASQAAEMSRRVLRALVHEANNGPRLFTLEPVNRGTWDPRAAISDKYRLQLYCEHPRHAHPVGDAWEFTRPKAWAAAVAKYAVLVAGVLQLGLPIAAAAAGLPEVGRHYGTDLKPKLDFMKSLAGVIPSDQPAGTHESARWDDLGGTAVSRAEGSGLATVHMLLDDLGWKPGSKGLRKVASKATGDVLWVCDAHRRHYDPGLPTIPEQE